MRGITRLVIACLAWISLGSSLALAQPRFADRVYETTTSTGTGTISLAGPVTNYRSFVVGIGTGNTTYYCIVHKTAAEWECGTGIVTDATPDTLSRDTVLSSSTGSAISFTAGTKDVFPTPLASWYTAAIGAGAPLTTNAIPKATGTALAADSCISASGTTVTVDPTACSGGIVAPSFTSNATGISVFGGAEGTLPVVSASGRWKMAMSDTDHKIYTSTNTGAWAALPSGASGSAATVLSFTPYPGAVSGTGLTTNSLTIRNATYFNLPYTITVNQLALYFVTAATPGTLKVCLYSADGTTKLYDGTITPVVSQVIGATVPALALSSGGYWLVLGCAGVSTCSVAVMQTVAETGGSLFGLDLLGKQAWHGSVTHTSGTCNSTLGTVTGANQGFVVFRMDN